MRADFHTHSTASDGTLAPAELVLESVSRGLSHVALTDHDTVAGIAEAVDAAAIHSLTVVPGVELSAHVDEGELHILGYGIDYQNRGLLDRLEMLREQRRTRATRMIERLASAGIVIGPDTLPGVEVGHSIGRPHLARALVASGYAADVQDAFDQFLVWGKRGYIPSAQLEPVDAVGLIRDAGGIAVMAHPLSLPDFEQMIPELIDAGLGGLECYYGEYPVQQREELAGVADRYSLMPTGGSDYHGPNFREGRELGSVEIPDDVSRHILDVLGM